MSVARPEAISRDRSAPAPSAERDRRAARARRERRARQRRSIAFLVVLFAIGGVGAEMRGRGPSIAAATAKPSLATFSRAAPAHAGGGSLAPLPAPAAIGPLSAPGSGRWHPAGRLVAGRPAVYETTVPVPSDPATSAGIAWMDTSLLRARLYSGSLSPGGFFWKYTAPVTPVAARTLVAAFNGGFLLKDSGGGYLSEGHLVAPLRAGAASIVIYRNGRITVGAWGTDVAMTPSVVAVRQNLTLLVDHGRPVAGLNPNDIAAWGFSLYGKTNTWRSGLGVTANGALVYVVGPMTIVDLAALLVRAGAVRAMTLDMNPFWPVYATYAPTRGGEASPANGTDLLPTMVQTPARFFSPAYSRDFVTLSAP